MKSKIRLSVHPKPEVESRRPTPIACGSYFGPGLQPYRTKVAQQLGKTQLRADLVPAMELALYNRAVEDIEVRARNQGEHEFETFKDHYLSLCRHLVANLKAGNEINNLRFIEALNKDELTVEKAITLNPQEMCPERWQSLIDKREHELNESQKERVATTEMYRCPKCHNNKCTYYQSQDRSSDEGFTTHITCVTCGKKWKC